jgi:hypothetical protein
MWFTLFACRQEPEVLVEGVVWDGPEATSRPIGLVDVEIVDTKERVLATTRADPDGSFSAVVAETGTVFVVLRKEGYATTTFPGVIGTQEALRVEDHALYLVSEEAVAAEEARFAGCESEPDPGADRRSVGGEVRAFGLVDPVTGESPIVAAAKVALRPVPRGGAEDRAACYLDDAGEHHDPEAFWTGEAGAFGVFGIEPGVYALDVRFEVTADVFETASYPVFVPDDPIVRSPWYPAWIEFPF